MVDHFVNGIKRTGEELPNRRWESNERSYNSQKSNSEYYELKPNTNANFKQKDMHETQQAKIVSPSSYVKPRPKHIPSRSNIMESGSVITEQLQPKYLSRQESENKVVRQPPAVHKVDIKVSTSNMQDKPTANKYRQHVVPEQEELSSRAPSRHRAPSSAAQSRGSVAKYDSDNSVKGNAPEEVAAKSAMPLKLVEKTVELHKREKDVLLHLINSQNELIRQISEEAGRLREAERVVKTELEARQIAEALNLRSPSIDKSIQVSHRWEQRPSNSPVFVAEEIDYPRRRLDVRRASMVSRNSNQPDVVRRGSVDEAVLKTSKPRLQKNRKIIKGASHSIDHGHGNVAPNHSKCCLSLVEKRHPTFNEDRGSSPGFTNSKLRASIKLHQELKKESLPSKAKLRQIVRQRDERVRKSVIKEIADVVAKRLSITPKHR